MSDQKLNNVRQTIEANRSRLVNVSQIYVNNTGQYRESFLKTQLGPLNQKIYTIEQLLKSLDQVTQNFVYSTAVENMATSIQQSGAEIVPVVQLLPRKRYFAKTGTNVGNGEGNGYITFQLRNFLKGGENLIFDATIGTRTKSSYLLNLNFPIFNQALLRSENIAYFNSRANQWNSNTEVLRGLVSKIQKQGICSNLRYSQELSLQHLWSTLQVTDKSASDAILLHAGDHLKTSVEYSVQYDSRDDKFLATKGKFMKLNLEYCFPFHSHFVKANLQSKLAAQFKQVSVTLSANGGILHSLNSGYVNLADKFYLGGPTNVRGFNYNGLGPRSITSSANQNYLTGGDRLGGNYYYAVGLSSYFKLPRLSHTNLRFHHYLNAGKLTNSLDELKQIPSVSSGVGILYNHPAARFELNFGMPLVSGQSDSVRKGIQWGIGLEFL